MKMSVLMVMVVLGLIFAAQSYAACTRTCVANVYIYYTYKEADSENRHKESIKAESFTTQGRFGGNCQKPSGRQKAKRRAREEAKRVARDKYRGKTQAQKEALCSKVPDEIKEKADWFKIDYVSVGLTVKPWNNVLNEKIRIPAATQDTFTCTPPSGSAAPRYILVKKSTVEPNTNRPGSDYRNFETSPSSYLPCKNICMSEYPKCKAWTYVEAGVQGPRAKCWLKDSVPASKSNSKCTSGVTRKVRIRVQ